MEEAKRITLELTPEEYRQIERKSIYNNSSIDDYIVNRALDKNLRDEDEERRTEIIKTRITPTELKYIQDKIKGTNHTMSEFIRSSVLDKNIIIIEDLKYITKDLKGISRNLNQALMLAHKGYIKEVDIDPTKKQVEEIWQLLNSLMVKIKK